MAKLTASALSAYRAKTYHSAPGGRLHTVEQAQAFVKERGFVYFWPIKGIVLPSLWAAVAGNRPVADEHDDPGHVTWSWKDSMLGKRAWYYAKILRRKATMISLDVAPYFYALSQNFGSPDEDYLLQYEQGKLTQEAKSVYEALLNEGQMDTITLRRAAHLVSRESDTRFNRALEDLQMDFKILPVAVAEAGAWRYAFVYDLVSRHLPDLPERARPIGTHQARRKLAELYFKSVGAAQARDVTKLFGWRAPEAEQTVEALARSGLLLRGVKLARQPGEWIALTELCQEA
jgi:DNA glycosylase AlkZ-like